MSTPTPTITPDQETDSSSTSIPRRHSPLLAGVIGALLASTLWGGVTFVLRQPTPPPIVVHPPPTVVPMPTATATPTPGPLVIYLSGAVIHPGIYTLPPGARLADALEQAGGLAVDADAQALNPAELLTDGAQVQVPALAPTVAAPVAEPVAESRTLALLPTPTPNAAVDQPARSTTPSGATININTATLEELDALPGIGPSRARDIILNRPYATVDDLDRVPGIGSKTLEQLRPLVSVE